VNGNKKNIFDVFWQLVPLHYLKIIGSQSEDELFKWTNSLVPDQKIKNLKDQTLSDG